MDGLEAVEIRMSDLEFTSRIDAEYYKKQYLEYEIEIRKLPHSILQDVAQFLIGPFGSAFKTDNYEIDSVYRYIRGQDVKPFLLQELDNKYMPKDDFQRLKKYALKEKDVLVSVVGTLGNACIIRKKDLPAIFSCKSTVLRANGINPVYILTYLNCKQGRSLLLRKERGAIQKGLNLDDLKSLLINKPNEFFQNQVEVVFNEAQRKLDESKKSYTEAETLLLNELNLHNWQPTQTNTEVKTFKNSFAQSGRLDAEYYQPKYDELFCRLKQKEHKPLSALTTIKKSIEPGSAAYLDEGIPFIRVANITKFGLTDPDIHLSINQVENIESLFLKKNTILLTKDGSVGISYKVDKDINAITSGAILHLTVKSDKVIPDYLTLVLNSILTQMQAERDAGGSIIQHWRMSEIEQVLIPIIDIDKQEKIVALIKQSFQLKQQSQQLLEAAKYAVEMAIEEGEEKAMAFIKAQLH